MTQEEINKARKQVQFDFEKIRQTWINLTDADYKREYLRIEHDTFRVVCELYSTDVHDMLKFLISSKDNETTLQNIDELYSHIREKGFAFAEVCDMYTKTDIEIMKFLMKNSTRSRCNTIKEEFKQAYGEELYPNESGYSFLELDEVKSDSKTPNIEISYMDNKTDEKSKKINTYKSKTASMISFFNDNIMLIVDINNWCLIPLFCINLYSHNMPNYKKNYRTRFVNIVFHLFCFHLWFNIGHKIIPNKK